MVSDSDIAKAARRLRDAERLVVLTGAGVSKESGVPTFRDAMDGYWAEFDPQDLATPDAFLRNPKLVWDWYESRRRLLAIGPTQPRPLCAGRPGGCAAAGRHRHAERRRACTAPPEAAT